MKHLLLISMILFSLSISAQKITAQMQQQQIEAAKDTTLLGAANESIKVITADENAEIVHPEKFNPNDISNIMNWWKYLMYGLFMPFGSWIFARFFPSSSKKELILKTSSIAIIVLIIIVTMQGQTMAAMIQASFGFIMQASLYNNLYKGLGMKSPRKSNYNAVG